ncbi:MAG: transcription termination/antitermination protein NusA [Gammaproteobacteria bacterium]|nr:transcription termination/antitermination protein NusA [Gammaproteobacteria bacterium]
MSKEKEIKMIIEAVSNEKDLPKDVVFEALEEALAIAHQRHLNESEAQLEVNIDRKTGEIQTFRLWDVVATEDDVEIPAAECDLKAAREIDSHATVGKKIRQEITSLDLGRISAQLAKQAVYQKLKGAKRERLAQDYEARVGELVIGVVKKTTRDAVVVDLPNGAEGFMPRREMIPRESFRLNDRVRAAIKAVVWDKKGPTIVLSRTAPSMLSQLFAIEVPEIGEGSIEIRAIARDPGSRAKVAVQAKDTRIEPKGACIGMRGARVNSVMDEISGERIDIILWDENDAQFVVNALAPAEVKSIVVDEDLKTMQVVVDKNILSQAIGKNGQNVRLASELTGWKINVISKEDADEIENQEASKTFELFTTSIGLESELAEVLMQAGFTTAQELAYVDNQEFYEIGFDDELIDMIRERAQEYLLEQTKVQQNQGDLSQLPGVHPSWIPILNADHVYTIEDLAELSTFDLMDLIPTCLEEEAQAVIMAARSHSQE